MMIDSLGDDAQNSSKDLLSDTYPTAPSPVFRLLFCRTYPLQGQT